MRLFVALLAATLAMGVPVSAAASKSDRPSVCVQGSASVLREGLIFYEDTRLRFEMQYPSNWDFTLIDREHPPSHLYPSGLNDAVLQVIFLKAPIRNTHIVMGADETPELTLDAYVDIVEREMGSLTERLGGAFTTQSRKETCLAGAPAVELSGKEDFGDRVYLSRRVFTKVDDVVYGFTYSSEHRTFRRNMGKFAAILRSFKVNR